MNSYLSVIRVKLLDYEAVITERKELPKGKVESNADLAVERLS